MVSDILNSIRAVLYERASNPLYGSFVASWLVWNYKLVLTLFSSLPLQTKFSTIDHLYASQCEGWLYLLVFPVGTSLLYIFALPHIARPVYKYHRDEHRKLMEIKQATDDEIPLTKAQSRELRRSVFELQLDHEKVVEHKDAELQASRESAELAQSELADNEDRLEDARKEADRWRADFETLQNDLGTLPLFSSDENEIRAILEGRRFRLIYNPGAPKGKKITFKPTGDIGEGYNQNEAQWRTKSGFLEILKPDGSVHSRFRYVPDHKLFLSTDDSELPNTAGQSIVPADDQDGLG